MGKTIRPDYNQMFLMPPSIEDWIGDDHPARFIRDFVNCLNLKELGFVVSETDEGRPPYALEMLLSIWLYGYMNRIRSSRKLEAASREHMSLIWLTGMNYPDHNTLWRFFKKNKKALKGVFRQSVLIAKKAGLVGMVLNAVDGTMIKAYVSKSGGWSKKSLEKKLECLDASIDEVMQEIELSEEKEAGSYSLSKRLMCSKERKKDILKALDELNKIGKKQLHPKDKG